MSRSSDDRARRAKREDDYYAQIAEAVRRGELYAPTHESPVGVSVWGRFLEEWDPNNRDPKSVEVWVWAKPGNGGPGSVVAWRSRFERNRGPHEVWLPKPHPWPHPWWADQDVQDLVRVYAIQFGLGTLMPEDDYWRAKILNTIPERPAPALERRPNPPCPHRQFVYAPDPNVGGGLVCRCTACGEVLEYVEPDDFGLGREPPEWRWDPLDPDPPAGTFDS